MALKQEKKMKQYINKLSTTNICGYTVDNHSVLYIISGNERVALLGRM